MTDTISTEAYKRADDLARRETTTSTDPAVAYRDAFARYVDRVSEEDRTKASNWLADLSTQNVSRVSFGPESLPCLARLLRLLLDEPAEADADDDTRTTLKPGKPAPGMTLRDHFAGQALAGFAASPHAIKGWDNEKVARGSYSVADAMLAERAKGQR